MRWTRRDALKAANSGRRSRPFARRTARILVDIRMAVTTRVRWFCLFLVSHSFIPVVTVSPSHHYVLKHNAAKTGEYYECNRKSTQGWVPAILVLLLVLGELVAARTWSKVIVDTILTCVFSSG